MLHFGVHDINIEFRLTFVIIIKFCFFNKPTTVKIRKRNYASVKQLWKVIEFHEHNAKSCFYLTGLIA